MHASMRKQKLTFFPESTLGSVATDTEGGVFSVVGVVVVLLFGLYILGK